jgi:hypothetical protein
LFLLRLPDPIRKALALPNKQIPLDLSGKRIDSFIPPSALHVFDVYTWVPLLQQMETEFFELLGFEFLKSLVKSVHALLLLLI